MQFSTGFTFEDEEFSQRPISIQKPLGMVLQPMDDEVDDSGVIVKEVHAGSNAETAGVMVGDILLSINNLDVSQASLASVTDAIDANRPDTPWHRADTVHCRFRSINSFWARGRIDL